MRVSPWAAPPRRSRAPRRSALIAASVLGSIILTGTGAPSAAADAPGPVEDAAAIREAKRELRKYLLRKSGRSEYPRPEVAEDEPFAYGTVTKQYRKVQDDKPALYYAIAGDLYIADKLLRQEDVAVRRSGVGVAAVAVKHAALVKLKDPELAAAICDAYLVHNLDAADPRREQYLSRPHLLATLFTAYSAAKQHEKTQWVAEQSLALAKTQNSKDAARFNIARTLSAQGKPDEAIAVLREVTDPGMIRGVPDFIKTIEARAKKDSEAKKQRPKD